MNDEQNPVVIANFITTLAGAVIALLVAFGLSIDVEQKAAILAVIGILAPVIATLWARRNIQRNYTPLANPRDKDGTPLVRKGSGMPTKAAQVRAARHAQLEAEQAARDSFRRS